MLQYRNSTTRFRYAATPPSEADGGWYYSFAILPRGVVKQLLRLMVQPVAGTATFSIVPLGGFKWLRSVRLEFYLNLSSYKE